MTDKADEIAQNIPAWITECRAVLDYYNTNGADKLLRLMKGDVEDYYNIRYKYNTGLFIR